MAINRFKAVFLILIILVLPACATLVGDSQQIVSVETPFCPKAGCELRNDEGLYFIKETPETVTVNKSWNDLTIECSKDGYSKAETWESSMNAGVMGNILIGGAIGILVDGMSGSGYDYDNAVVHPLRCTDEEVAEQEEIEKGYQRILEKDKQEGEPTDLWADEDY